MKKFSMLGLSTVLVLGVLSLSDSAFAQQKVTKDQLMGTWTLVSCTNANGSPRAFCANVNARMMLDAMGQYMNLGGPRGRTKCSGACGRAQMSGEQYKAIAQGFAAEFGTWSFNEADQTLTRNRETALFPNNEGEEFKEKVSLSGDELRLVHETGFAVGATDIWRRVR